MTDVNNSPDDATLAGYETIETIETVETDDTVEGADTVDAADSDIDLDAIEADLDGVERALRQLAEGTYWNDGIGSVPIESA